MANHLIETLETRRHLAADRSANPYVDEIYADNRGQIVIVFNRQMRADSFTRQSVNVFESGADGRIATADDVRITGSRLRFSYDPDFFRLTINVNVSGQQNYRIRLNDTIVSSVGNLALDGEFGVRPDGKFYGSGNTVPGGNLNFIARLPANAGALATINTSLGVINVRLSNFSAQRAVNRFVENLTNGVYDNTVFHNMRAVEGSLSRFRTLSGGAYKITGDGDSISDLQRTQLRPQRRFLDDDGAGQGNTAYTLAFSKDRSGTNPRTVTDEFFFNGVNNPGLNTQDGGYTAFAEVVDGDNNSTRSPVLDRIARRTTGNRVALVNEWTSNPAPEFRGVLQGIDQLGASLGQVPLISLAGLSLSGETDVATRDGINPVRGRVVLTPAGFSPEDDLVRIEYVSLQMNLSAIPTPPPTPTTAP